MMAKIGLNKEGKIMICQNCGITLKKESIFCLSCGNQKNSYYKAIAILFIAFLIIGLGVGGYFLWGSMNDSALANISSYDLIEPALQVQYISAEKGSSFVILSDGSLWAWGSNNAGQLGDGTTTERHIPVKIMEDVIAVSAVPSEWGGYAMAIRTDGSLWAWGCNRVGQLGDGTTINRYTPVKIMEDVVIVSTSHLGWNGGHTMAIKTDGSLWAWGRNSFGQLGDGTTTNRYAPVKIMDDVAEVIVSTGNSGWDGYTMAIRTDGSLWAWGNNRNGYLGDGTTINRHTPVRIMDDVATVSVGSNYTMAIRTDGSLWSWGSNWSGQLGDGTSTRWYDRLLINNNRRSPVRIMEDVATVSIGNGYAMAIKTDGSLWAWGNNSAGRLGDGTSSRWGDSGRISNDRYSPVKIMNNVAYISVGNDHSMAITYDGILWGWGSNSHGKIGDGTANMGWSGDNDRLIPTKIMDSVALVSAGKNHTMAVTDDGNLWAWGSNLNGEIGNDFILIDRHLPTEVIFPSPSKMLTATEVTLTDALVVYRDFLMQAVESGFIVTKEQEWDRRGIRHIELINFDNYCIPNLVIIFNTLKECGSLPLLVMGYTGQLEVLYRGLIWGDGGGAQLYEIAVTSDGQGYLVSIDTDVFYIDRDYLSLQNGEWVSALTTSERKREVGEAAEYFYINGAPVSQAQFENAAFNNLGIIGITDVMRNVFSDVQDVIDMILHIENWIIAE